MTTRIGRTVRAMEPALACHGARIQHFVGSKVPVSAPGRKHAFVTGTGHLAPPYLEHRDRLTIGSSVSGVDYLGI